ncbi:hypothetical protein bAD24_III11870 [Burkholderia sp. AD24]|nr:hypothetical protein bAD24_III11870 [Burkholderia sp. AD24]
MSSAKGRLYERKMYVPKMPMVIVLVTTFSPPCTRWLEPCTLLI